MKSELMTYLVYEIQKSVWRLYDTACCPPEHRTVLTQRIDALGRALDLCREARGFGEYGNRLRELEEQCGRTMEAVTKAARESAVDREKAMHVIDLCQALITWIQKQPGTI